MPETIKGLWRQRLRWSVGGTQAVIAATWKVFFGGRWRLSAIWLNYVASILWAYCIVVGLALWLVNATIIPLNAHLPFVSPIPGFWGAIISVTYLLQAVVSVSLDARFERGVHRSLFWIVWYPLAFWLIQAFTATAALPKAILRPRGKGGTWTSPDRGIK
jgi:biofilm PGA synthesis N-glycosyltransferase PgaC